MKQLQAMYVKGQLKMNRIREKIREKGREGAHILRDTSGISVIELLLILVVFIALVLIFKNQLIDLVNTIFQKITNESSGI